MATETLAATPDPDADKWDMIAYGKQVVVKQKLVRLREGLNLSRNAMAELLNVSPITYTSWEVNPKTRLWPQTARKIAAFYQAATNEISIYGGIRRFKNLVPFHLLATMCGIPHELLLRWYREGMFEAVDLGVLGLWVSRSEINKKLKKVD